MSLALRNIVPEINTLITEDDEPVDNLPSEKQQRLLTETLYSSWNGPGNGRTFLAAANVGVFYLARRPAVVPDVFLSLDVEVPEDWWEKEHRSYFLWEFGKAPDLAIEIVSNREGDEDGEKRNKYARMQVPYYVILDPLCQVMSQVLTIYRLNNFVYELHDNSYFPHLNLGLKLWEGKYEGKETSWLRWVDEKGDLILSGKERAEQERLRANEEQRRANEQKQIADEQKQIADEQKQRAEQAELLLEQERLRAERLAKMLRQLGQDPTKI